MAKRELKLRESSSITPIIIEPSRDTVSRIHQLRVITAAYLSLTNSKPNLPNAESPLPALLALRSAHACIKETKASLLHSKENLLEICARIRQEESDLIYSSVLTSCLQKRCEQLRDEQNIESQVVPTELGRDLLLKQQAQKRQYERNLKNLIRAFNKFVVERLAGMLAAEELGGPAVREMIDISEDRLRSEYDQQVELKNLVTVRKQQPKILLDPVKQNDQAKSDEMIRREAAGAAFRTLSEDLLNAAADDDNFESYITIKRTAVEARFLVRSKVAQFHSQDATKLRLVEFCRELDE